MLGLQRAPVSKGPKKFFLIIFVRVCAYTCYDMYVDNILWESSLSFHHVGLGLEMRSLSLAKASARRAISPALEMGLFL